MKRKPPLAEAVIVLDLDDTLIATSAKIKPAVFRAVEELGVPALRARAIYARVRRRIFSPARYARALFPRSRAAARAAREAIESTVLREPRAYNFAGVLPFLARLARRYTLILVSWGDPRWKNLKVANARIARFFDAEITVSDIEKRAVLLRLKRRHGRLLLLDDKEEACSAARTLGIPAIRVRKGEKDSAYYRRLAKRIDRSLVPNP